MKIFIDSERSGLFPYNKIIKRSLKINKNMKLKIKTESKKPYMIIEYENDEWSKLEDVYQKLGLEIADAKKLYGKNIEGKIYKLTDGELRNYLSDLGDVINDVNEEILSYDGVNLGVLRIIPDENNKTMVPLPKYLNIIEVNQIAKKLAFAIEKLLSTIIVAEINIIPKND
jgi:hypothetical protein